MMNIVDLLSPLEKYLLILLSVNNGQPLRGELWMQKEMFLIGKNVNEVGEDFEGYLLGPYSEAVKTAADQFERSGIITRDQRHRISLTSKGEEIAKKIYNSLDEDQRGLVEDIKELLNDMTRWELLAFIYSTFPETTDESDIKEEVEKRRLFSAISLFRRGKLSLEKSAEVAGLSLREFIIELKTRGIPLTT